MKILITGNTGFKGTWLTFVLKSMGHNVHGLALPPENNSLYVAAGAEELLSSQSFIDIRDFSRVDNLFKTLQPELIFHLAAQPLVRDSYKDPRYTIETNTLGTFNVLEATRNLDSISGILIITTDKVYRNIEQVQGYKEDDPLGGHDPYSASKAMADIIAHSWAVSYATFPVAIARAGNVVGGGDFSKDRLIPDIVKSISDGTKLKIRYPESVRPWQHVLDCLSGYIALANNLNDVVSGDAWNFGPDSTSVKRVQDIVDIASALYPQSFAWSVDTSMSPYESGLLNLDSDKAQSALGWRNKLDFETTLNWTFEWYSSYLSGTAARELTMRQIEKFLEL